MKNLIEEINKFNGNVVSIGVIDDKIQKCLRKNKNISLFELEINTKRSLFSKKKRVKISKEKSVRIKKFRTAFKKKSIEYVVIDLNNFYDYYKYMASNSIFICNKKIYIYGNSELIDSKSVEKKFKRYKTKINSSQNDNEFFVIVDSSKAKFSLIKEKFFIIIDTFGNLGDIISYFLTS